ncbi:hypothetical protein BS50DRAFT_309131 [Corynespora cassiicola Philippines]|uniref:G protein-coupled receptor GPR1/2/3 C-terminal domain-containing protein n=1 Tax=Corynespora cassiicola Philippines TaxID=1448308 RepID=A0A2T2NXU2_CORCC|nr:hypothetical protein BS50DRAFT_309131 [Corynespora cassiicola Philippines]
MVALEPLDAASASLPKVPDDIHPWLRAVVSLAILSFACSVVLLTILTFRLIQWHIKSKRTNQFVILIFNLLWADIQQALAFLLNVEWLRIDAIDIENPVCFAQGWLVSTGDLGSGVWCFVIGLHTFASVILDFRLKPRCFYLVIFILWIWIFGVSAIGIGMHGTDLYVRSGVWCWINHEMVDLRLWTHYTWIFIFEFGNVLIYAVIYMMLIHRIRSGYYTPAEAKRVKAISNLMVVYPVIYVICTIPLASARMAAMSGNPPSLKRLCLAGAMITSNGWLDVLLYTFTRRIMIFSDEPPADNNGIDTFAAFWADQPKRFGGACTIEALRADKRTRRGRGLVSHPTKGESSDDLCNMSSRDIKLVTTTHVLVEPAQPADYEEMEAEARKMRPKSPVGRWSEDSANLKDMELAHIPD